MAAATTIVEAHADGGRLLIGRPDGSSDGALSLSLIELLARAKATSAAVCVLPAARAASPALMALRSDDVRWIEPSGVRGKWLQARWDALALRAATGAGLAGAAAVFWREIYRELRRHVGDERLPYPLRTRLRAVADRSLTRSGSAERRHAPRPFARRLLRHPIPMTLPPEIRTIATGQAAARGIDLQRPLVAVEAGSRQDYVSVVDATLRDEGSTVVRIDRALEAIDLLVLMSARFVVCESARMQQVAYLTNTPCLRLNAVDPVEAYPIRADGLFTLAMPVELTTGRELDPDDISSAAYLRRMDRYGHRRNRPHEVSVAVQEMRALVAGDRVESPEQARFRQRMIDAAADVGAGAWGPDEGFLGDGRLARAQLNRHS